MVGSRHTMENEPACPSLNRLAALMQRVYRVRELIVADPLARVALVSVQTDLMRVQKLIKRHRAICAHCKLNQPLRENPSHKTPASPKVVPINCRKSIEGSSIRVPASSPESAWHQRCTASSYPHGSIEVINQEPVVTALQSSSSAKRGDVNALVVRLRSLRAPLALP